MDHNDQVDAGLNRYGSLVKQSAMTRVDRMGQVVAGANDSEMFVKETRPRHTMRAANLLHENALRWYIALSVVLVLMALGPALCVDCDSAGAGRKTRGILAI